MERPTPRPRAAVPSLQSASISKGRVQGRRSGPIDAFIRTIVWSLEPVASVSVAHREELSGKLGGRPVYLNAADWGWAQRPRLYRGWLTNSLIAQAIRLSGPALRERPDGH